MYTGSGGVHLSKTIYMVSAPTMAISRICGLAPMAVKKMRGYMLLTWSNKYALYSLLLVTILVTLTIIGVVRDLQANDNHKVRMKRSMRNVTCVDISAVILTVLVAVLSTRSRLPQFLIYVNCLNEIDATINTYDTLKERKKLTALLAVILGVALLIFGVDVYVWFKISRESSSHGLYMQNYFAYYLLYSMVVVMECQFCHIVLTVKNRIANLNGCLKADTNLKEKCHKITDRIVDVANTTDRTTVGNLIDNLKRIRRVSDAKIKVSVISEEYVAKLIKAHEKIYEAAAAVTECYGITILIIILSCLLHLIVTPYFFLLELNGRRDPMFISLQVTWIVAHICRLLLIVEPCHSCVVHAKATSPLVCKLLGYDLNDNTRKQLEIFAIQCLHRQIEFSACGLARIDRQLLTGIAGAVTTYLVILFQFEKNN